MNIRSAAVVLAAITILACSRASADNIKLRCEGETPGGFHTVAILSIDTTAKVARMTQVDTKPGVLRRQTIQDFRDGVVGPMATDISLEDMSLRNDPTLAAKEKAARAKLTGAKVLSHVLIDDDRFAIVYEVNGRKAEVLSVDRASGDFSAAGGGIALKCAKDEKKF